MEETIAELQSVKFWVLTATLGIVFSVIANLLTDALKASWKWPQRAEASPSRQGLQNSTSESGTSIEPTVLSFLFFVGGLTLFCLIFPPAGGWGYFRDHVIETGPAAMSLLLFDPRYPAAFTILGYAAEAFGTKRPPQVPTWRWVGLHMTIATALTVLVASIVTGFARVLNAA